MTLPPASERSPEPPDGGHPTTSQRHGRRRHRGRTIAIIAGVSAVVVIAIVAVIAVFLRPVTLSGPDDPTPVAAPASAPADDDPRAFYSFGHTGPGVAVGAAGPAGIDERLPFVMTADAVRYRLVVRNTDYREDSPLGPITVNSVYLGTSAGEGRFAAQPVRLGARAQVPAGGEFQTDWFDASAIPLTAGGQYLLGLSFSATGDVAVGPGVGWVNPAAASGSLADRADPGEYTRAGTYLDVALEFTFQPTPGLPVTAVFGHSLNAGANGNPDVPHGGESTAWHQLWAQQNGGIASSFAAAGSWSSHFTPDSTKWELASAVDANVVVVWASSSDLVSGVPLADVGSYWEAIITKAREEWPRARIVAMTEPPRSADGAGEDARRTWNDVLRTRMPAGIDGLVDADRILADPADPSRLAPEFNGDDSHMSPAGHQAIADAYQAVLAQIGPLP